MFVKKTLIVYIRSIGENVCMSEPRMNFHHLHYFWAVAKEGNLTRAAKRLRVSQSALSAQIRQLEAQLREPLFERQGRGLVLTEAGDLALEYADVIFSTGEELLAALRQGRRREQVLRMGAVATLSRNFQESFIKPLLTQPGVKLRLQSASLDDLLTRLSNHELDLVLANQAPRREPKRAFRCRRIARQEVSMVGHRRRRSFRFPEDVQGLPLILPGLDSDIRAEFDALCEKLDVVTHVVAEVDDMATMRLLARDIDAVAVVPSVVVRDELQSGVLHQYCIVPSLFENFYAITVQRQYQHPLLRSLLKRDEEDLLDMQRPRGDTKA